MIDHIVFDIGKVLIHYDPSIPYARLIPDAAERQWFLEAVCTNDWNLEQDRGRSWADAEALLIEAHPGREALIRAFRQHWHEMVSHAYEESVAIMRDLIAQGRDVTLLTNFSHEAFPQAREIFPFLTETRGVTVSGEVGHIKPDRAIYDLHADRFGLVPARTLFIDDSVRNVEGARAAGWKAVAFEGAGKLRRDLREYGIGLTK